MTHDHDEPYRTDPQVPLPALERLATYIRCLMQLENDGVWTVSSQEMEKLTGVSAAQFRKDLSYFGEFGKRGIGYDVVDLHRRIAQVLRIQDEQSVLLVGAGHLGSALIAYPGWKPYRFRIAAVFDKDPEKIGTQIRRLPVLDIETIEAVNAEIGARMGIIGVPAWEAQSVADRLVRAGVHGLINFAPTRLTVPEGVRVREVCFICELTVLSYLIQQERGPQPVAAGEAGRARFSAEGGGTGAGLPLLEDLQPEAIDG
jgi:redox-sensing transcriptional repressor